MIDGFLLRLVIAVLVFVLGEKVIGLVKNADLQQILTIVLILGVVLYAIFGNIFPAVR